MINDTNWIILEIQIWVENCIRNSKNGSVADNHSFVFYLKLLNDRNFFFYNNLTIIYSLSLSDRQYNISKHVTFSIAYFSEKEENK